MHRIARTEPKDLMPASLGRRGVFAGWTLAGFGTWLTESWVRSGGRRVEAEATPWLERSIGGTELLGARFFSGQHSAEFARPGRQRAGEAGQFGQLARGLLDDFSRLDGPMCSSRSVDPRVVDFFECTSEYRLELRSEWCGVFRPVGTLLTRLLGDWLLRLDFPPTPRDRHLDLTSAVLELEGPRGSEHSLWIREAALGGTKLRHAGDYALCTPPGYPGTCIRTIHPLAHGFANIVRRPESQLDGSLALTSRGEAFGGPGIYWIVRSRGCDWVRRVGSVGERIHVYVDPAGTLRADRELRLWDRPCMKLHYRIEPEQEAA